MSTRKSPCARPPLLEGPYDLAVVGGGINGAGIARDAVLRGKSVILLEKGDFAAGTSSRSSKMVHGGIRYLEQLRLGLVHESLRERQLLLSLAPHLVRPQSFVLPVYAGARRGPWMIRLGLFLYDALALGKSPGRSSFLGPAAVLARAPALGREGLVGAGVYHDGVMDDARLVLANVLAAAESSEGREDTVVLRSHAAVMAVRPGTPCAVDVEDRVTGERATLLAHRVVRALGPWTEPEHLVPSKGVHIVLPPFPMQDGLLLTHARDGRVFFVVPWLGCTVVGTTETPFSGSPDALRVEPEEVSYLLEEVQRVFPGLKLGRRDLLGTFAGVRPLATARGLFRRRSPGSVSRVHRIVDRGDGIISVFGGKYTTYRAVAEEVLDRLYPGSACETRRRPLPGGEEGNWEAIERALEPEVRSHGREEVERLFRRYGSRLRQVLALVKEDPALGEKLSAGHPEIQAEVVHAVRREFAVYPEDFLARRTTLRYREDGGRSAYDAVDSLMRKYAPAVPADLDRAREKYFAELEWEDRLRGG